MHEALAFRGRAARSSERPPGASRPAQDGVFARAAFGWASVPNRAAVPQDVIAGVAGAKRPADAREGGGSVRHARCLRDSECCRGRRDLCRSGGVRSPTAVLGESDKHDVAKGEATAPQCSPMILRGGAQLLVA